MNKKTLSESDVYDKYIRRAMETVSWNGIDQNYRKFPRRTGCAVVRGQRSYRDKYTVLRADYVLLHKLNIPLAVVEIKGNNYAFLAKALIVEVA